MILINKYKVIIAISGVIIILVCIRSFNIDHFKNNAKSLAGPSFNHSIIISEKQIGIIGKNILFVYLDKVDIPIKDLHNEVITIKPDSILNKENLRKIIKHKGSVLIISSDPAVSARIWMILSQMGRHDVFILTDHPDNEVFKNKFRPDTLNRLEL